MISFKSKGDFKKTKQFLKKAKEFDVMDILDKYGKRGVDALSSATPLDSGETAAAWSYEIHSSGSIASIYWTNSNINKGVNIAIILQYGHGTGGGGWVQGRDYINPALHPVMDDLADEAWKEVSGA